VARRPNEPTALVLTDPITYHAALIIVNLAAGVGILLPGQQEASARDRVQGGSAQELGELDGLLGKDSVALRASPQRPVVAIDGRIAEASSQQLVINVLHRSGQGSRPWAITEITATSTSK